MVTVSLVTFNGRKWLPGCLRSLSAQTLADYELLVVDNASVDGTLGLLQEHADLDQRMSLFVSDDNLGYAAAHNRNLRVARGEFVLLLNQDVELDAGFLGAAVSSLTGRPEHAAVQGRFLRLDSAGMRTDVIDSTGLEMSRDRRVVARRQGEKQEQRDLIGGQVWGVDGPCAVYRWSALSGARVPRTGGGWEILDEDFFMYKEDVDLAWRLRLLGWRTVYEPKALAWHARGAGGRPGRRMLDVARSNRSLPRWIKAISWRNHRLMQVKNEDIADYVRDLPWIARREILSLGLMAVADPGRLVAVRDLVRRLPAALRKRRSIRTLRRFGKPV